MRKIQKEKIKLTVKEILLNMLDITVAGFEIFDGYNYYRDQIRNYQKWRELDKINFSRSLYQLKKQGYIEQFKEKKKKLFRLTETGKKKALKYLASDYRIKPPKRWDKKWRIVIFDIPEKNKHLRDVVRQKLQQLGFCQLQKSVWVYPYECKQVIDCLKYIYSISPHVQYIIAESIESEIDLVGHFYDKGILTNK